MWKWLDSLSEFAMTNARVLRDAWGAFLVWCLIACVAIWWAIAAVYDTRLKNNDSLISFLSTQLTTVQNENRDLRTQLVSRQDRPNRWSETYSPTTDEQLTSLASKLTSLLKPGQTIVVGYVDNPSAVSLGQRLVKSFKKAGLLGQAVVNPDDDPKANGITLFIRHSSQPSKLDQSFVDAFRSTGFAVKLENLDDDMLPIFPFELQVSYPGQG